MQKKLSKMIQLASTYHSGQFDKSGVPYILHCLKVMYYLKSFDEELNCIAVGHDLLEDTEIDHDIIRNEFGERVYSAIRILSKNYCFPPSNINLDRFYLDRIKTNPDAIRVKLADLRHNSDIMRLKGITEKDVERMKKYHSMYLELKAVDPSINSTEP